MAQELAALRKPPVVERRPAAAATVQLSAAAASLSPAQGLQQRLGSRGTHSVIARSAAAASSVSVAAPASIQFARVSQPSDPAELEAKETARKVVQMGKPAAAPVVKPEEEAKKKPVVQRSAASTSSASVSSVPAIAAVGGSPLPAGVRSFMEPRFGADFGNVRVHTGETAAQQSTSLNAHAFTLGEHVFFGRNQYRPENADGRELIAHELTHTIQQGAVIQRSADTAVSQRIAPRIQRLGIGDALDYIADKANFIPGFRLLTIVLGMNPINLAPVERSAANTLRALLELIPVTGALLSQALESYGIFARVGTWIEAQIRSLGLVGGTLKGALTKFLDSLSWRDVFDLGGVWERGKRIFTEPIDRLISFGKSLATDILRFIREAILLPLAKLAEGTRGYDLLKAVLGEDPVTGQPVPRTPETLIGGFLKLIGQEDIWENMKKAGAIPRAWAWFQAALAGLMGFVRQIPSLFMKALNTLEVIDLVLPVKAFAKLVGVFGNFVVQFATWGANAAWTLLEIIFDVVSPGALKYVKKTGAALKSILKNPLPFVGNLVRAAKLGFTNFAEHFLDHLKTGLIDWLTGSLPGIYIPKAFSLVEIAKFVFSVLGLSWANIRAKLVKVVGETAVKAMETGFDIVVTLVRDGPAAAWDKIKEQLTNLKDMVIGGITDFVVDTVVKKAIPKLISMFIPGAGFISAILSIYDTIMVFVNKISKIIQVVTGFIDSIVAIAAGAVGAAATRVENILAGLLSLAINFLAGFVGLGKVADKIMAVINKVRAPIDKAIDWLINWIVTMAKKLFAKGKAAVGKLFNWAAANRGFKDDKGQSHTVLVDISVIPPRLAVASDKMAAEAFLEVFIKGIDQQKNAKKIKDARDAIAASQKVIVQIDAAQKKDPQDNAALLQLQQTLLEKNTVVAETLRLLVGRGKLSLELRQMYLLEGLTGTYGSIPKPKGDNFTADHQPQAAVLEAAREFGFFDKTGKLFKRAANRAKEGYAINLHKIRHEAGATFGSKGKTTKEQFNQKVKERVGSAKTEIEQRKVVIDVLRQDLDRDVKAMQTVASPKSAHWSELKDLDEKERTELIEEVSGRILKGEQEIAKQDLDSLVG